MHAYASLISINENNNNNNNNNNNSNNTSYPNRNKDPPPRKSPATCMNFNPNWGSYKNTDKDCYCSSILDFVLQLRRKNSKYIYREPGFEANTSTCSSKGSKVQIFCYFVQICC